MVFGIEISAAAERDVIEVLQYISKDSPVMAKKWFDGFVLKLESLRHLPMRNAVIPEARVFQRSIRAAYYKSHRIAYEVNPAREIVFIIRVYHGARRPISFGS